MLNLSPEQQEVWNMEEKYWHALKALDREGYLALWDENFIGWPHISPAPVGKDAIRSNTFGALQGRELKSVRLEPKAVEVSENVAVVHYVVTGTYAGKDSDMEESLRITHTWRKASGVWLIIGGMSSPVTPLK